MVCFIYLVNHKTNKNYQNSESKQSLNNNDDILISNITFR